MINNTCRYIDISILHIKFINFTKFEVSRTSVVENSVVCVVVVVCRGATLTLLFSEK